MPFFKIMNRFPDFVGADLFYCVLSEEAHVFITSHTPSNKSLQ